MGGRLPPAATACESLRSTRAGARGHRRAAYTGIYLHELRNGWVRMVAQAPGCARQHHAPAARARSSSVHPFCAPPTRERPPQPPLAREPCRTAYLVVRVNLIRGNHGELRV